MADAIADTRHVQQMLRDAGYDVTVDGIDGPATQEALQRFNASRAGADRAKAQADAAAANARAEEAKARAEQTRAEAEAKRLEAENKKRSDEAAAETSKRIFDTGITIASYATGATVGAKAAAAIDKKVALGLKTTNAELAKSARELKPMIGALDRAAAKARSGGKLIEHTVAKMSAAVATADKAGITKVGRGPAGPAMALGLVGVGLASRYLASQTENETVKTVLNATGTMEAVAGALVGVKDLANRAAPTKMVDVKSLSVVEQARALVKLEGAGAQIAAATPTLASRALSAAGKIGGKIALPVAAAVATVEAIHGYREDGARGAARGALTSLDPTGIVMEKGLVERVFDRLAGPKVASADAIAAARVAAGREAAGRALAEQRTPYAASHPAVALDLSGTGAGRQHAPSAGEVHAANINHGWTDAARHASQVARGVNVTIPGR